MRCIFRAYASIHKGNYENILHEFVKVVIDEIVENKTFLKLQPNLFFFNLKPPRKGGFDFRKNESKSSNDEVHISFGSLLTALWSKSFCRFQISNFPILESYYLVHMRQ